MCFCTRDLETCLKRKCYRWRKHQYQQFSNHYDWFCAYCTIRKDLDERERFLEERWVDFQKLLHVFRNTLYHSLEKGNHWRALFQCYEEPHKLSRWESCHFYECSFNMYAYQIQLRQPIFHIPNKLLDYYLRTYV